jgi:hypothetical protein
VYPGAVAPLPFPPADARCGKELLVKYTHATPDQPGIRMRTLLGRALGLRARPTAAAIVAPPALNVGDPGPEAARAFHRRMSAIIESVQVSIWERGVRELLGYSTDFALGQARGVQTLVLKTRGRSAYLRVHWDTLMSDAADERARVEELVRMAVQELS